MLFQVAGCIGVARKCSQNFAFPKLICHDMVERFGSTEDPEVYKYLLNPLPEISLEEIDRMRFQRHNYFWEWRDGMLENELYLPTGNWDMYAHFQSIKFFEHCIDEVRHYFTFKDEFSQSDEVAIHMRFGDYIDDGRSYHPVCSKEYYEKAVGHFPLDTKFVVFSDGSIEQIQSKLPGVDKERLTLIDAGYLYSFKRMKSCKSFICANSSYSHMAALLGTHPEKKIIMPRRWFGEQAGGLNFDSLYPQNAIVI